VNPNTDRRRQSHKNVTAELVPGTAAAAADKLLVLKQMASVCHWQCSKKTLSTSTVDQNASIRGGLLSQIAGCSTGWAHKKRNSTVWLTAAFTQEISE